MFKTIGKGKAPTKGTKYSAAIDLYASETVQISVGETKLVGLGVKIDMEKVELQMKIELEKLVGPDLIGHPAIEVDAFEEGWLSSHYLQLIPRSSMGKKLIIPHGVGIIDIDYPDEIMIRLHNSLKRQFYSSFHQSEEDKIIIKEGDRIAQVLLLEHNSYLMNIHTDIARNGGFGSTGDK